MDEGALTRAVTPVLEGGDRNWIVMLHGGAARGKYGQTDRNTHLRGVDMTSTVSRLQAEALQLSETERVTVSIVTPTRCFFRAEPQLLHIVAVAHQRRHPDYWSGRR